MRPTGRSWRPETDEEATLTHVSDLCRASAGFILFPAELPCRETGRSERRRDPGDEIIASQPRAARDREFSRWPQVLFRRLKRVQCVRLAFIKFRMDRERISSICSLNENRCPHNQRCNCIPIECDRLIREPEYSVQYNNKRPLDGL